MISPSFGIADNEVTGLATGDAPIFPLRSSMTLIGYPTRSDYSPSVINNPY
jgi:hypothetical protein